MFLMALGDVGLGGILRFVMLVPRLFEAIGFVQAYGAVAPGGAPGAVRAAAQRESKSNGNTFMGIIAAVLVLGDFLSWRRLRSASALRPLRKGADDGARREVHRCEHPRCGVRVAASSARARRCLS